MARIAAIAPVAHCAPVETGEPAIDRFRHPALDNLGQRLPGKRAIALASLQTIGLHPLHELAGHRQTPDRRSAL